MWDRLRVPLSPSRIGVTRGAGGRVPSEHSCANGSCPGPEPSVGFPLSDPTDLRRSALICVPSPPSAAHRPCSLRLLVFISVSTTDRHPDPRPNRVASRATP